MFAGSKGILLIKKKQWGDILNTWSCAQTHWSAPGAEASLRMTNVTAILLTHLETFYNNLLRCKFFLLWTALWTVLCLLQYHVKYPVEVQAPQPIDIVGFQQKMNQILRVCKRNQIVHCFGCLGQQNLLLTHHWRFSNKEVVNFLSEPQVVTCRVV